MAVHVLAPRARDTLEYARFPFRWGSISPARDVKSRASPRPGIPLGSNVKVDVRKRERERDRVERGREEERERELIFSRRTSRRTHQDCSGGEKLDPRGRLFYCRRYKILLARIRDRRKDIFDINSWTKCSVYISDGIGAHACLKIEDEGIIHLL